MSSEKPEKSLISFMKDGLKLEWGTPAGRYNVFWTSVVTFLVVLYSISNVSMTIIYAICFKEKYPILSLWETLQHPIFWGTLCFVYMIFMSYSRFKASEKLKEKGIDSKDVDENLECNSCNDVIEEKCE